MRAVVCCSIVVLGATAARADLPSQAMTSSSPSSSPSSSSSPASSSTALLQISPRGADLPRPAIAALTGGTALVVGVGVPVASAFAMRAGAVGGVVPVGLAAPLVAPVAAGLVALAAGGTDAAAPTVGMGYATALVAAAAGGAGGAIIAANSPDPAWNQLFGIGSAAVVGAMGGAAVGGVVGSTVGPLLFNTDVDGAVASFHE